MSKYKAMVKDKLSEGHDRASNLKGGVRGKVGGLIPGRSNSADGPAHVAMPLSSLRDPSSFAPPPKRTNSGLAPPPPPPKGSSDRRLLEAAAAEEEEEEGEGEGEEDRPPPQPYRVNTTGLSTDHLPPPPGRRDGADGRSPPPYDAAVGVKKPPAPAPAPSLPPRLPPRAGSGSQSPERTSTRALIPAGSLNQGAVSRLGAAGISVPGFGIGSSSPANTDTDSPRPPPPPRPSTTSQLSGLQNRFSKLNTSTSSSTAGSPTTTTTTRTTKTPPSEGTTWAQKQAALKTASSFHKDPSSVSLADARAAASTTNNFLQRHGDQVAAGIKSANSLNQKYGVADKVGGIAAASSQAGQAGGALPGLAGKKKPPPPPPPKKKPGLARDAPSLPPPPAAGGDGPPPIPMSTRPVF